ncbi:GPI transamidase component PIG-T [Pseudolycoriella hygida]|uniref:GPI transamidase component PIG-T n=1 Tax=Pseudolycoriella hygida TaxID=35572 RepID=A0A9Q0RYD1_9DIPT|nr:GPI transamidase component PIG-T [Pseudolycoriella hygida]
MIVRALSVVIIFVIISESSQFQDEFHEELFLKPLPTGHINSYFQFSTEWTLNRGDSLHHTNLVSRSIAEIFHYYHVKELHISLSNGLWRYENWGYPVVPGAPGAEVWAWFDGNLNETQVNEEWKNLCGTLSGLLCASLSFIDNSNTLKPKFSFRPEFADALKEEANATIRYATLPREIVCTENLTPWKKLLPCNNREGFISLLNSGFIHSTSYHSLGLHIRTLSQADSFYKMQIKQTVNLVFDKKIVSHNEDWSIRRMFGQGLTGGGCFLAKTSKIYVDVTDQDFDFTTNPTQLFTSQRGGSVQKIAEFDMKQRHRNDVTFNIATVSRAKNHKLMNMASPPPLYAKRFTLGVGQEHGKIVTKVTNTHWASLNVVFQENIPWFVPIYLHSLKISNGATTIEPTVINYVPGVRRERPYELEIAFTIPARTTVEIAMDFDYIFLKWLEYPPDANHGHYLGSAVLSVQLPVARNLTGVPVDRFLFADSFNASRPAYFVQIRTEALLISLPTPDFSMPYNVICLTCTVVALAFGPIHNISTKKIVIRDKDGNKITIIEKVKRFFMRKKNSTASDVLVDTSKEKSE